MKSTFEVAPLLVDKYKPKSIEEIIGHNSAKTAIINYLKNYSHSSPKAILLSGSPGIGKTTLATIIPKSLGYHVFELNASDSRNKLSLQKTISPLVSGSSIFPSLLSKVRLVPIKKPSPNPSEKTPDRKKKIVVVMDEVDGMSGGDRGGTEELVNIIKKSKVPMILICNDKSSPKMKPLLNVCLDLGIRKPAYPQIVPALSKIALKEGLDVSKEEIQQLTIKARNDIRNILHTFSVWKANGKAVFEEVKKDRVKNVFETAGALFRMNNEKDVEEEKAQKLEEVVNRIGGGESEVVRKDLANAVNQFLGSNTRTLNEQIHSKLTREEGAGNKKIKRERKRRRFVGSKTNRNKYRLLIGEGSWVERDFSRDLSPLPSPLSTDTSAGVADAYKKYVGPVQSDDTTFFDLLSKALVEYSRERRKDSGEKNKASRDHFFSDYGVIPLFVFENYLNDKNRRVSDSLEYLSRLQQIMESFSAGNKIDFHLRKTQNYSYLAQLAYLFAQGPCSLLDANWGGSMLRFPGLLGVISTMNKNTRILGRALGHRSYLSYDPIFKKNWGKGDNQAEVLWENSTFVQDTRAPSLDVSKFRMFVCEYIIKGVFILAKEGKVEEAAELLDIHCLTKEDFDDLAVIIGGEGLLKEMGAVNKRKLGLAMKKTRVFQRYGEAFEIKKGGGKNRESATGKKRKKVSEENSDEELSSGSY